VKYFIRRREGGIVLNNSTTMPSSSSSARHRKLKRVHRRDDRAWMASCRVGRRRVLTGCSPPSQPEPGLEDLSGELGPIIDRQGYARHAPSGERIMPNQIPAGASLRDLRGIGGSMAEITWADGSTGVLGHQLTIRAAA
jgi:hypothetical protein